VSLELAGRVLRLAIQVFLRKSIFYILYSIHDNRGGIGWAKRVVKRKDSDGGVSFSFFSVRDVCRPPTPSTYLPMYIPTSTVRMASFQRGDPKIGMQYATSHLHLQC